MAVLDQLFMRFSKIRHHAVTPCMGQVEQVSNTAAGVASYLTGTLPRRACVSVVLDQVEQVLNAVARVASYLTGNAAAPCMRLRGHGPSGAGLNAAARGVPSDVVVDQLEQV